MNKKTPYERTITGKLQQLPLPDGEDAIWARIKTQLDEELPTDENGDDAPDIPSGGGWRWGIGLFVFVAALLTVFFYTKKPTPDSLPALPVSNPTNTPSAIVEKNSDPPQPSSGQKNNARPAQPTGPRPFVTAPITAPLTEAPATPPVAERTLPDSLRQTTLLLPPSAVPDTSGVKKKPRGVPGITENDYRIVPRKDSL